MPCVCYGTGTLSDNLMPPAPPKIQLGRPGEGSWTVRFGVETCSRCLYHRDGLAVPVWLGIASKLRRAHVTIHLPIRIKRAGRSE
jgi:hypothetical protein